MTEQTDSPEQNCSEQSEKPETGRGRSRRTQADALISADPSREHVAHAEHRRHIADCGNRSEEQFPTPDEQVDDDEYPGGECERATGGTQIGDEIPLRVVAIGTSELRSEECSEAEIPAALKRPNLAIIDPADTS